MIEDRVESTVGAPDEEAGARGVRADSIVKNTAFSYATQLTTASLTALMTVFLVRALGPAEYGIFALALSVSSIALGVADAGVSSSTARFAAEHRHDRSAVGALFVNSLKLKIMVTGFAALTLVLLATPIAHAYGEPGLVWPLRAIGVAMFGQSFLMMLMTVGSSLGRTVQNLRIVAIESVLEVSATIGLVLLGLGAAGAAVGRAIGYVLGALIGLVFVLRLLGRPALHLARPPDRSTVRRVGGYAGSLFIVDTAYTVSSSVNVLLIGAMIGTAATGVFQAPMKLITFLQYVGLSTANGVAPRLARSRAQEPNVAALRGALRGLIAFQCVLLAPVVVWAGPITGLVLGPGYAKAAGVLTALAPYIFFSGLAPTLTISVNYVGEARRRVPIALATVVLTLGASALLIPSHGVIGAAVATDVAYGFYTLAHLWLCRRLVNLRLAPLVWSLACALTAAAAMAIVLAEIGTKDLSPRDWLLGAVGGVATYVAMLLFTRELRGHDLVLGFRFLRRVVRALLALRPPRRSSARRREPATPSTLTVAAARLSPADAPQPALPLVADPAVAGVAESRGGSRTRRRGPAVQPSVRALEGTHQPEAPTSPGSPPRARPSTPAAEPPRWLQGAEPPVRRPEPQPPSTPAAEPPAWARNAAAATPADAPVGPGPPAADRPTPSGPSPTPPGHPPRRNRRRTKQARRDDLATPSPGSVRPTYEISWRGDGETGVFELRPVAPGNGAQHTDDQHQSGLSLESAAFPWGWQMHPAPVPEARRAHQDLVERLLTAGWERMGMGDTWFAHRLRPPVSAGSDAHSADAPSRRH
jgi:O-antigen/teichoic acid export membrane protein